MQLLPTDSNTAALRIHEAEMSRAIQVQESRDAAIRELVAASMKHLTPQDIDDLREFLRVDNESIDEAIDAAICRCVRGGKSDWLGGIHDLTSAVEQGLELMIAKDMG